MRLIRTGQVRVDGGRKKPFYRVQAGQTVRVPPIAVNGGKNGVTLDSRTLHLVHKSEDLLAVAKPAGLPTHPGSGHVDSVSERLKAMFPDDPFTPTPAHRLDKDTSGLLLAARSYKRLIELQRLFKESGVGKYYLAWVQGEIKPGATVKLADKLSKQDGPKGERVRAGSGKEARASLTCLKTVDGASLAEVKLETGRTHQIRVQLASRGMPIIGDTKYGSGEPGGMLLHCWKIVLPDMVLALPPDWPGRYAVHQDTLPTT
jgi:23S rRNA pseudouridine955/2504/2580 synthase